MYLYIVDLGTSDTVNYVAPNEAVKSTDDLLDSIVHDTGVYCLRYCYCTSGVETPEISIRNSPETVRKDKICIKYRN